MSTLAESNTTTEVVIDLVDGDSDADRAFALSSAAYLAGQAYGHDAIVDVLVRELGLTPEAALSATCEATQHIK